LAGAGLAGGSLDWLVADDVSDGLPGRIIGEPTGEAVGARVLAEGGNVFDAIVAAAFAVAVAAPNQTGLGGYGAHGLFATAGGRRLLALDANTTAPRAMRPDLFQPGVDGTVPGRINETGWLAAGVPGVPAGLDLVLRQLGTRPLDTMLQPAIELARTGFRWPASLAGIVRNSQQMAADPGSRRLYFHNDQPIAAGELFQNPELADLLERLAAANSVEPFYRGDVARQIAAGFQRHGGLVTFDDLAAYEARLVEPLTMRRGDWTLCTAPLTAGGLTVLQTLHCLQALDWEQLPAGIPQTHAAVEALRRAWFDRLMLLGDPQYVEVPQQMLLSLEYARDCADQVRSTVKAGTILHHPVAPRDQGGTIHLSAADREGNFAALTLTHGNAFGAQVTVEGLGLTLGHGMSRFDPDPAHPNSPAPGKRPLNNMVPFLILRGDQPVCAVGGRGGQKIPNAVLEFLIQFVDLGRPLAAAVDAPRVHTTGDLTLEVEPKRSPEEIAALKGLGYTVKTARSAVLSGVARESGELHAAMR
jgi:gamma-glutamyltranspeptidase/glutathione hydrolase